MSAGFEGRIVVQIGVIVRDVDATVKAWSDIFGLQMKDWAFCKPEHIRDVNYHEKPTAASAKVAAVHMDNTMIEFIQPLGAPSEWQRALEQNGPGVHHIAFAVKGMEERIIEFEQKGIPLLQQGRWTGGSTGRFAYFDTAERLGTVLELLEELD